MALEKVAIYAILEGIGRLLKVITEAIDEYARKKRVQAQADSYFDCGTGSLMRRYNKRNKAADDSSTDNKD